MRALRLLIIIFICFIHSGCGKFDDWFGAGSNVHSEDYTIKASEEKVLAAVDTFKTEHPEYCPPIESDAKDYYSDPFHEICFYYTDKRTIVATYIRGDKYSTTFGLQAIRKEGEENARLVNKDITGSENESVKLDFVTRILNPIKEIIGRK